MKIYTKTGDAGKTSLLGGSRVAKYHLRIEAYGTVDELNAHIGLLRSYKECQVHEEILLQVQDRLFTIGSELASEPGDRKFKIPQIQQDDIEVLEKQIDQMDADLPPMRNFVLPGGSLAVSQAHVARCVCRRAERIVLHLKDESDVKEPIPIYLNRLSDFLFILSRKLAHTTGVVESPWKPKIDE